MQRRNRARVGEIESPKQKNVGKRRKLRNRISLDKLELVGKIDKTRINILTRDEFIRFLDEETETWLYFFVRACVCV